MPVLGSSSIAAIPSTFYPETYGAVGDGSTNDTTALQSAINAAVAANGTVRLAAKTYAFTALTISGPCTITGSGVYGVYDAFSTGVGNFTPTVSPYLKGTLLKCTATGNAAAIDITGESATVDLADFGLTWSTLFATTGHGIRSTPGSAKNGLSGAQWRNISVFGHDGNSYAFYVQNIAQCNFYGLKSWGGGMFKFEQNNGSQYGNSTLFGCCNKLIVGGSAHCAHLAVVGGNATRMSFIGCEFNALSASTNGNYKNRVPFTGLAVPTSSQSLFVSDAAGVRGLSFIGCAFDGADSNIAAPSIPGGGQFGGQFVDPGGFFYWGAGLDPAVATPPIPMVASPPAFSSGTIPLGVNPSTTNTTSMTLSVTSLTLIRRIDATTGNLTVTLPDVGVGKGRIYTIKKIDSTANTVTVTAAAGQTMDGVSTKVLTTQYATVKVYSNGTTWDVV